MNEISCREEQEKELISLIRNAKDPEKAMDIALEVLSDAVNQTQKEGERHGCR